MEMDLQKVYVTRDMEAVLSCPHCGSLSKKSIAYLTEGEHTVDSCCGCGNEFRIHFDYRSRFRRELFGISGTFVLDPPGNEWMSMTVKNISPEGVAIRSTYCRKLKIGDTVRLRFSAKDAADSGCDSRAKVRHVTGELAGCQFEDKDCVRGSLDYYLL